MNETVSPIQQPREAWNRRRVGSGCTTLTPETIRDVSNLRLPMESVVQTRLRIGL